MKKMYIVEIEKAIEIRTDGTYLTPNEIEEEITRQRYDEFFNEIARAETLEEARKIFEENKTACISEQHGRKIEADELRIREVNFDDEGEELEPDGMEIIDSYVAMLDGYVLSENGKAVNFELATTYMDYEICENLNSEMYPCTDQEFLHFMKKGIMQSLMSILQQLMDLKVERGCNCGL